MRKYQTQSVAGNSHLREICKTKGQTVPDQTLTVREILYKYANGTLNDLQEDYDYSGDDEDYRGLDPSEMHAMATESSKVIKDQDERKKRKAKKDYDQSVIDKYIADNPKSEDDAG